jgi:hypothetical protein
MNNTHNIGELNENHLHVALKDHFYKPGDLTEEKLAGFTIDIIRGNKLIEIQTGNFSALKKKLIYFLGDYQVNIVHPIIQKKTIIKISDAGEIVSSRKSPKTGKVSEIFKELIYIPDYLQHPNFSLTVPIVDVKEYWIDDGKGSWRRKGWSIQNKKLIKIHKIINFKSRQDYLDLLPENLPDSFTNKELSKASKMSKRLTQKMTFCLRKMELIEIAEKKGNAFVFQIIDKAVE